MRERFGWKDNHIEILLCGMCIHQHENRTTCTAYPDGIPVEILTMRVKHNEPYKGDKGLQFKPKKL